MTDDNTFGVNIEGNERRAFVKQKPNKSNGFVGLFRKFRARFTIASYTACVLLVSDCQDAIT
ncbi:MAG: hypothetical protein NVSMB56_04350 [Pyrinomonadaceae bacterium]